MTLSLLLKCGRVKETQAFYAEIMNFEVADGA